MVALFHMQVLELMVAIVIHRVQVKFIKAVPTVLVVMGLVETVGLEEALIQTELLVMAMLVKLL